jgi:hypothetical protein
VRCGGCHVRGCAALSLPLKRNLGAIQVDRWPHEALSFAFAQAENQNQNPQG